MTHVQVEDKKLTVIGSRGNVTTITFGRGKLTETRKLVQHLMTPQLDLGVDDARLQIQALLSKETTTPMMVPNGLALGCFMAGWSADQLGSFGATLIARAYEDLAAENRLSGTFQESEIEALFSNAILMAFADVMKTFRKRLSPTDRVFMELVGASNPSDLVNSILLADIDGKRRLMDDPFIAHFEPFEIPRKSPPSETPTKRRHTRKPQARDVYLKVKGGELRLAPDFTPLTYQLIARKSGVLNPHMPASEIDLNALAKEVFEQRCSEGIGGPCPMPRSIEIVIRVLRISGMTPEHAWQLSGPAIAYVFDKLIGREGVRRS